MLKIMSDDLHKVFFAFLPDYQSKSSLQLEDLHHWDGGTDFSRGAYVLNEEQLGTHPVHEGTCNPENHANKSQRPFPAPQLRETMANCNMD